MKRLKNTANKAIMSPLKNAAGTSVNYGLEKQAKIYSGPILRRYDYGLTMKILTIILFGFFSLSVISQETTTTGRIIDPSEIEVLIMKDTLTEKQEEQIRKSMNNKSDKPTITWREGSRQETLSGATQERKVDMSKYRDTRPPVEFYEREEGIFRKFTFLTVEQSVFKIETCGSPNISNNESYSDFIKRIEGKTSPFPISSNELIKVILIPCESGGYIYYGFWLDEFHGVLEKS